jgi:hypothetical protein
MGDPVRLGNPAFLLESLCLLPINGEKPAQKGELFPLAEDGGFEPPRAFTQHAFQACAIGH